MHVQPTRPILGIDSINWPLRIQLKVGRPARQQTQEIFIFAILTECAGMCQRQRSQLLHIRVYLGDISQGFEAHKAAETFTEEPEAGQDFAGDAAA